MPVPSPISSPLSERELVLVRETDVPRERLFAGWTQPELIVQWFTPKPWTTTSCELDLRVGGTCKTTMRSPEGEEFPNVGVYLEIVPNERLVFTAILTFETLPNGKTRYTARAVHWTTEAKEKHAAMGFAEGWGKAFDQLV